MGSDSRQRDCEVTEDRVLARAAVDAAALALTGLRTQAPSEGLGARGDALAHQTIMDILQAARPGDAVLSEEAADDRARLSANRVWIVDPLDGTREYAETGRRLDAEVAPLGSAGYKIAAVIRGEVDAYVHGGGQYEWDSAAPVTVAWSAGLHASRLDGATLVYNSPDPQLPDLLVSRPEPTAALLEAMAMAGQR